MGGEEGKMRGACLPFDAWFCTNPSLSMFYSAPTIGFQTSAVKILNRANEESGNWSKEKTDGKLVETLPAPQEDGGILGKTKGTKRRASDHTKDVAKLSGVQW